MYFNPFLDHNLALLTRSSMVSRQIIKRLGARGLKLEHFKALREAPRWTPLKRLSVMPNYAGIHEKTEKSQEKQKKFKRLLGGEQERFRDKVEMVGRNGRKHQAPGGRKGPKEHHKHAAVDKKVTGTKKKMTQRDESEVSDEKYRKKKEKKQEDESEDDEDKDEVSDEINRNSKQRSEPEEESTVAHPNCSARCPLPFKIHAARRKHLREHTVIKVEKLGCSCRM